MLIKLAPVIAITLVSGCTLTNSKQYHQETLAAIQALKPIPRKDLTKYMRRCLIKIIKFPL